MRNATSVPTSNPPACGECGMGGCLMGLGHSLDYLAAVICNSPQPDGWLRCELKRGHQGAHRCEILLQTDSDVSARYSWHDGTARTLPSPSRGRRLARRSSREAESQAYWAGITDAKLKMQAGASFKRDGEARFWCEAVVAQDCPELLPAGTTFEQARQTLSGYHTSMVGAGRTNLTRAIGFRLSDRDPRGDDYDNHMLTCGKCRAALEPKPLFQGAFHLSQRSPFA